MNLLDSQFVFDPLRTHRLQASQQMDFPKEVTTFPKSSEAAGPILVLVAGGRYKNSCSSWAYTHLFRIRHIVFTSRSGI